MLEWSFHTAKRPVRSPPAVKILAATKNIKSLLSFRLAIQPALGRSVKSLLLVDSKNLRKLLST